MSSVLRFKDKKFFIDSLKVFKNRKHGTFEINSEMITVASIDSPCIFVSLDNSIFSIDFAISFTVRIDELIENINKLNTDIVIMDDSFKLVEFKTMEKFFEETSDYDYNITVANINQYLTDENNYSYIEIPFINPILPNYQIISNFPTRMIISKDILKNLMSGLIKYSLDQNKLILSKQTPESEEIMEVEVDLLESSHLDFYCSNDWLESINEIEVMINTVLLCFAERVLSVKFLFKDKKESYLEVQVQEVER